MLLILQSFFISYIVVLNCSVLVCLVLLLRQFLDTLVELSGADGLRDPGSAFTFKFERTYDQDPSRDVTDKPVGNSPSLNCFFNLPAELLLLSTQITIDLRETCALPH